MGKLHFLIRASVPSDSNVQEITLRLVRHPDTYKL